MHDGVEPHSPHHDRAATIAALPALIRRLKERKLETPRLDDLLALPAYL
jgi:peptidoglycan/xylan/chitin deacetylase (PgdA/CDA1 family)